MSSRKFINSGDYRLVLQDGRLVVQRPDSDQGTAAIEIGYDGVAPSGYIGVTNGAFKYGFDASVPFDVYHEGRPPDITEIDLLDQDFPSARVPNVLYVAENGVDSNTGKRLSEPKRTIKAAMATADLIQARSMGHRIRAGQTQNDYNGEGNNGRFVGGSGYNITDLITLDDDTEVTVVSVSGGAVTGFEVTSGGQQDVLPRRSIVRQQVGTGSGFRLLPGDANTVPTRGRTPVSIFLKAGRYRENNPVLVNRKVGVWGDNLRNSFVSPRQRPFLVRANWGRAILEAGGTAWNNPGGFAAEAAAIDADRDNIIADIESFVETNYPGLLSTSQLSRCLRDTGLILDALIADLDTENVGTHSASPYLVTNAIAELSTTYRSERAAAYYYKRGTAKIPQDQIAPTVATLNELISRLGSVSGLGGAPLAIAQELVEMIRDTVSLVSSTASPDVPGSEALAANRSLLQNTIRAWINDPNNVTPGLLSPAQRDLCVRDVGLIVDAVEKDLRSGGVDRTEDAALSYYRQAQAVVPSEQRLVTVQALDFLRTEATGAVPGPSQDRVDLLMNVVARTIEQPIDRTRKPTVEVTIAGNQITGVNILDGGFGYRGDPRPALIHENIENEGDYENAAQRLRINRSFIQEVVADYVNEQFQQGGQPLMTQEQFDLCKRDVGFVVDAIVTDLREGGSTASQEAALNYFLNDASVLPQSQREPTRDTFAQIALLANSIVRNEPVPELYSGQSVAGQKTPGGFPVSGALADILVGTSPAPSFDTEDVSNFGIVGQLIQGVNNTITDPRFPAQLVVADILAEVPRVNTEDPAYRPAVLAFDVEDNSLASATIRDGGNLIGVSSPQNIDTFIPEPDDGYDLFYVNNGCYFAGMTFNDLSGRASAVAFDQLRRDPLEANETRGFITTSPYVQNCSTINPREEGGVGMKINGRHVRGLRSMVSDAFTQINTAGTGVYLLNRGYAQLVSIFTVSTNIGILAESGGQCSVANSNSSFGNFGLISRGVSDLLEAGDVVYQILTTPQTQADFVGRFAGGTGYTTGERVFLENGAELTVDTVGAAGTVTGFTLEEPGTPVLQDDTLGQSRTNIPVGGGTGFTLTVDDSNITDTSDTYPIFATDFIVDVGAGGRRPAFGDAVLFDVTYTALPDTPDPGQYQFSNFGTLISDEPRIEIRNNGVRVPSYFYRIVRRAPDLTIEFLPTYTETIGTVTAQLRKFYTVENSTEEKDGLFRVTLDLGITQTVDVGVEMQFYQRSLITSSAHTFEYVGAGTDFLEATPAAGGTPIRANEIIQDVDQGGSVYFTSTDDKGDFRIGPELTINRNTGTITGEAFERSLFTVLTPYILSLE